MKINMERSVTAANDAVAEGLRRELTGRGMLCINLISAPGSGKTALIEKTVEGLSGLVPMAVIEGDPHTELDSIRVRATGVQAIQINTLGGCHLDAAMVKDALFSLDLVEAPDKHPEPSPPPQQDPGHHPEKIEKKSGLIIIENVGNLLCPAPWDLGEHLRVVVASLPEGADKPLKYPETFINAHALVINKIDLEPALRTKVKDVREAALTVNPRLEVFPLSCETGEGADRWCRWLEDRLGKGA